MPKTDAEKSADAKRKRLWMFYRITPEEQVEIENYQRTHDMAILMGESEDSTGTDHDHTSGLIRGRLDFRLNKALGILEQYAKSAKTDLKDILDRLSAYMLFPPATSVLGPRYGLIGKAQKKKRMVYGSPNGPLPVEKKVKKPKKTK